MIVWDTFGLFQSLLDEFAVCLSEARDLQSDNPEDSYSVKLSIIGFSRFCPLEKWDLSQYHFIQSRLAGGLADLKWFEEDAEAVRMFACLCLRGMLGKLAAGDIDDIGFLLGEAHLAGFNYSNDEAICRQWNLVSLTGK